ncbi:MAG: Elongation factor 4 [Candidatus Moranbacteria bacterium GW2011_GWC2_37_73]|nr:MAG: GTP-binding protein LepA, GTP-binding protein LepA [Parcubacteria group bacterium GW2011_GWC1_36_108]KKQ00270.1 MAG: Elongation factor 4 [Candidatus Moranbacteria bacterium GW2011_GWD1_36_198]KKQ01325.1 MAG: Elongation factor 4 [Candidatus Moranbacteria bacterium GW2011_GWD2_36_198]KKQ39449.1 MAG: Elongation factor 4 [Candidatus Moranbacteria bacterium GW2011_GWC2_37_73]
MQENQLKIYMKDQQIIRNFAIIAHIDHGKSTLADRLLEVTKTVEMRRMKEQLLDQMDLERERGITIKLQPARMNYSNDGVDYVLNLIDTPGHVDFGYEVSRSLAAVEGAVLLVDATKGVQAQTLSNLYLAIEQDLEIIPVVNKVDLPNANVEKTKKEIIHILGCKEEEILEASGKTGIGIDGILKAIVEKIPAPRGDSEKPLRALIFDSKYDTYKGVLAYVRIVDGHVKRDDEIRMMATQKESGVIEVGYFKPEFSPTEMLTAGDIGYIATGLKSVEFCRVGDTITVEGDATHVQALEGYKEVRPMVYAGLYPLEGDAYNAMRDSLEKLKLNDASFVFEPESNLALGKGFRCGFLGLLHLEIIRERLEREFDFSPTITTPSVVYEIKLRGDDAVKKIYSATQMPDPSQLEEISEPYVKLDIITPAVYLGSIMELMGTLRSTYLNTEYIDLERILLSFEVPLMDIIVNFHDDLKSVSSGYASMSYDIIGYRKSDLIKLDILLAGEIVEALGRIVPRDRAHNEGKRIVEKLAQAIPRQNFVIPVQASIGAKIIARETIRPFRKDVIAKLYGGDVTRKNKLLDKQKKGKKKMRNIGKVQVPSEAYLAVLKR